MDNDDKPPRAPSDLFSPWRWKPEEQLGLLLLFGILYLLSVALANAVDHLGL